MKGLLIGEAPGREEDRAGLPFVGRAGQLLEVRSQGSPRAGQLLDQAREENRDTLLEKTNIRLSGAED